jgi:hypothetical protein
MKRKNANCAEDTVIDIGSKREKEKKRKSEVKGSKSMDKEIKDDRSTRKMDHGKLSKRKNHRWILWSTAQEGREDRLAKP